MSEGPSDNATEDHTRRSGDRVLLDVGLYAGARLLLVVVLTGAICLVARLLGLTEFPVVVAALFALIIAMPWESGCSAGCVAGPRRRCRSPPNVGGPSANNCKPGCAVRS